MMYVFDTMIFSQTIPTIYYQDVSFPSLWAKFDFLSEGRAAIYASHQLAR